MITIEGLSKEKHLELKRIAKEKHYRYTASKDKYNVITDGYDITFTSEISVYITTSYETGFSTVNLLALGQHFITLKFSDYTRIEIE